MSKVVWHLGRVPVNHGRHRYHVIIPISGLGPLETHKAYQNTVSFHGFVVVCIVPNQAYSEFDRTSLYRINSFRYTSIQPWNILLHKHWLINYSDLKLSILASQVRFLESDLRSQHELVGESGNKKSLKFKVSRL